MVRDILASRVFGRGDMKVGGEHSYNNGSRWRYGAGTAGVACWPQPALGTSPSYMGRKTLDHPRTVIVISI
jgi:hypothetical protein